MLGAIGRELGLYVTSSLLQNAEAKKSLMA